MVSKCIKRLIKVFFYIFVIDKCYYKCYNVSR
nr:MAG TPA: hypothetical protein [Caudoviricetes sp.]